MSVPARSTSGISLEGWALIVLLSVPFGGSFFFYRVLAAHLPALTIVLGRVAIAAPVLYALLRLRGGRLDIRWGDFAVMAMLNNVVPFTLYAWAETRVSAGIAAILAAFTPIASAVLLHLFGATRLTGARVVGVALGLGGVAVLVGPDLREFGRDFVADLACLGGALCYGFASLWGRRLGGVPPVEAATGQIVCSTFLLIIPTALIDRPWTLPMPGAVVWLNLFGIALASTALAYVLFFRLLRVTGPANVMLMTFLNPVSALAMAAAFLGEPVTLRALGGVALIGAGLAALDGRLLARARAALASEHAAVGLHEGQHGDDAQSREGCQHRGGCGAAEPGDGVVRREQENRVAGDVSGQ
jgi:drug/metabolite transporter (DMT)-like permease